MITYIDILMPFVSFIVAYLLGGIPTAVIFGKLFFKQDIRKIGSGNPGGTNATRAWGKKIGFLVIAIDMFKAIAPIWIAILIFNFTGLKTMMIPESLPWGVWAAGFGSVVGHCFSIYLKFKGGKGVSTIAGFVGTTSIVQLIFGIANFSTTLFKKRMVSLASIMLCCGGTLIAWIYFIIYKCVNPDMLNVAVIIFTPGYGLVDMNLSYPVMVTLSAIVVIIRHKENIKRIATKSENLIKSR